MITVQVLGGFSIRRGSTPLQSLPRQPASLLAYLLLSRGRPHTRDLLAGRFWSEASERVARRRLSQTLWQIKAACVDSGIPPLIETTAAEVRVVSDLEFTIDVERFLADLDAATDRLGDGVRDGDNLARRLAATVDGYSGELLEGYYDDWIEAERFRVRERYLDAVRTLVRLHKARSDYASAVRYALDLLAEDRLDEELHREVIRLYALLGQPAAAERQYNGCVDVMAREFDMPPSAETVDLIEQVRSERPSVVSTDDRNRIESERLVGRTRERELLLAQVDSLVDGRGGLILIEGDAGMGKTHLVGELTEAARWRDLRVLSADNTELSAFRAYGSLKSALVDATAGLRGEHLATVLDEVWLQKAAEVFPDLVKHLGETVTAHPVRPAEEPARMSEALARVVLAQGGLKPTLVVLEDIHWSDDDTMEVLATLGDRLERSGVLLCLSYRRPEALQSEAVWAALARLERQAPTTRISLEPLRAEALREMITSHPLSSELDAVVIDYLVEAAGGQPLFIAETLKDPTGLRQVIKDLSVGGDPLAGEIPTSIAAMLTDRVGHLPDLARRVLEALAVLAEPAQALTLGQLAGTDRVDTLTALTQAVDKGLVVELDDGFCRFGHDKIRRDIYEAISEPDRLRLHGQVADLTSTEDADGRVEPDRAAYHSRLAQRWEQAHHWHLVVAENAEAIHAYRTAVEHYAQAEMAAEAAGIGVADRVDEALRQEAALEVVGRREAQARLLRAVAAIDLEPTTRLDVTLRQIRLLGQTDAPAEAMVMAHACLAEASDAGLATHTVLATMGLIGIWSGDFRSAVDWTEAAFEEAPADDRIEIETWLAKALNAVGQVAASKAHAASALAHAEAAQDYRLQIEALGTMAANAMHQTDLDEAARLLSRALEMSTNIGYVMGEAVNLTNLASVRYAQGHGGQALESYSRALEVLTQTDSGRGEGFVRLNSAEVMASLLGDYEAALVSYRAAADYFRSVGDQHHEFMALIGVAEVEGRRGDRRLARRLLQRVVTSVEGVNPVVEVLARRALARGGWEARRWEEGLVESEKAASILEQHPDPAMAPSVLAQGAVLNLAVGRLEVAVELAEQAAALNERGATDSHIAALWCHQVFTAVGQVVDADTQVRLAFDRLSTGLAGLAPDQIAAAWRQVPAHVEIAEAHDRRFPRLVTVRLPRSDAAKGRKLESDEFRSITWTLSDPADWETESSSERRKTRILRLVREAEEQQAVARVVDLSQALQVSERTIKRDLASIRGTEGLIPMV